MLICAKYLRLYIEDLNFSRNCGFSVLSYWYVICVEDVDYTVIGFRGYLETLPLRRLSGSFVIAQWCENNPQGIRQSPGINNPHCSMVGGKYLFKIPAHIRLNLY
jgi:hypothetical protein